MMTEVLGVNILVITGFLVGVLVFRYSEHVEREHIMSQIDSSLRKADSLRDAESFEEETRIIAIRKELEKEESFFFVLR